MAETQTRIVIADDHPLVRGALGQALSAAIPAEIAETADLDGLMRELEAHPDPDLVLLDLAMPGMRGLSGLLYLRAQHPAVHVGAQAALGAEVGQAERGGVVGRGVDGCHG